MVSFGAKRGIPCRGGSFAVCAALDDTSPLPQLQDGVARPLEKIVFVLSVADAHRRAEADGGEHRHGGELALRQHAIEVVDVDRHELDVGPGLAEAEQAALEFTERRAVAARPLGEDDERMPLAESVEEDVERIRAGLGAHAVDEHGVEDVEGEVALHSFFPVVARRDGAREDAQPLGQRGPDEDEVEVAGVVRGVDGLPLVGGGVDAPDVAAGEEAREADDARRGGALYRALSSLAMRAVRRIIVTIVPRTMSASAMKSGL